MTPWQVVDLGRASYRDVWAQQLELVAARQRDEGIDTLLLVEHPHVITVGRSLRALANVLTPGDVEVVEVERGGDVTYHGPGQLVAYPILALAEGERDLHKVLRHMEAAVIEVAAEFGLTADREPSKTGVWLTRRDGDDAGARKKLCSMGIACRRWVTFHGLALNVATDLAYFARINPCGFEAHVMTTMEMELGQSLLWSRVQASLTEALGRHLSRRRLD